MKRTEILYKEIRDSYLDRNYLAAAGCDHGDMSGMNTHFREAAGRLIEAAGPDGRLASQDILNVWETDILPFAGGGRAERGGTDRKPGTATPEG